MSRNRTVVTLLIVSAAAIVAGVLAFQWTRPAPVKGPTPAVERFYRQSLSDSTGTVQAMSDYRGKVVVVNFWATWCVPCVQEIPAFSKANIEASGQVAFVGLGIDSPDNIRGFAERFKPSYALLVAGAEGTDLARAFGNESGALPFTVVLSPDGQVVGSHLGRVDEAMLKQWTAPYLPAAPVPARASAPRTDALPAS